MKSQNIANSKIRQELILVCHAIMETENTGSMEKVWSEMNRLVTNDAGSVLEQNTESLCNDVTNIFDNAWRNTINTDVRYIKCRFEKKISLE